MTLKTMAKIEMSFSGESTLTKLPNRGFAILLVPVLLTVSATKPVIDEVNTSARGAAFESGVYADLTSDCCSAAFLVSWWNLFIRLEVFYCFVIGYCTNGGALINDNRSLA